VSASIKFRFVNQIYTILWTFEKTCLSSYILRLTVLKNNAHVVTISILRIKYNSKRAKTVQTCLVAIFMIFETAVVVNEAIEFLHLLVLCFRLFLNSKCKNRYIH